MTSVSAGHIGEGERETGGRGEREGGERGEERGRRERGRESERSSSVEE